MRKTVLLFFLLLAAPTMAFAHQPRLTESRATIVTEPEVSKAFYGQLKGEPDTYTIIASSSFDLYVNILVPDIADPKKDVSATIMKDGAPLAELAPKSDEWKRMFEPFGYEYYWQGPEYKARAGAGTYVITVQSTNNDSKYSLATGELEKFDLKETLNAVMLTPQLKRDFFNEAPIGFILSLFGWGTILVLYSLAAIVGLLYRFILQRLAKHSTRGSTKNIGTNDRLLRLFIGIALLLWAITTNWSLLLIFFSGFALFEAAFSWCGLYAALGKTTCAIA